MSTTKTLRVGDDEITLRAFTEAEAIAYADKEAAALSATEKLADYLDDGDDEVLACVVSPSRAAMLDLLEIYPGFTKRLAAEIWRLSSGAGMVLEEVALTAEEAETHGKHAVVLLLTDGSDKNRLIFKRFGRTAYKFLLHAPETKKRKRVTHSALASAARQCFAGPVVLAPALWERYPSLSMAAGEVLWLKAQGSAEAVGGK